MSSIAEFKHTSNLLFRYHYASDHFLRLDFADEERLQMRWDRDVLGDLFVKERVGGILQNPLNIAGRDFEFLGYSNSGLREHSVRICSGTFWLSKINQNLQVWFVAPFLSKEKENITAERIRERIMGFSLQPGSQKLVFGIDPAYRTIAAQKRAIKFQGDPKVIALIQDSENKLRNLPSKLGARLAQAFTTTEPSVELKQNQIEFIDDIKVEKPLSSTAATEFTDGYGCISPELADEIWEALNPDSDLDRHSIPAPSAYQV